MPIRSPEFYSTSALALRKLSSERIRLKAVFGTDQGKEVILPPFGLTIGSNFSTQFQLDDPLVSGEHVSIKPNGPWWVVEDLRSENGSFLNGKLIKRSAIFPGEILRIGNTELTIEFIQEPEGIGWVKRDGEWLEIPRIIAHELRNYLEYMDIGVEHLGRDPEIEQRFHGEINSLKLAKQKMDELVTSLRAGCIAPKLKPENLSEILWEQLAMLESYAQDHSIKINTGEIPDTILIKADRSQLSRVFLNLIKNAFEACQSGDNIFVNVRLGSYDIEIDIRDTGIGMDQDTCESIWTPLFTTKPNGNGLGAFIARTIILRHNGSISAASEEGDGTTIRVKLPLYGTEGA